MSSDTNVDPSSSMQVVNALIKNNKSFDMMTGVPGEDHPPETAAARVRHTATGSCGISFVHNLLNVETPHWNTLPNGMRNASGNGAGMGDDLGAGMFGPSWESIRESWNAVGRP